MAMAKAMAMLLLLFLLYLWLLMLSLLLLLPQFLFLFRFVFICFCFTFMASSCSRAEHAPLLSVCLGGGSVNIFARTEISCSVQLRQLKHFLCSFMVYLPKSRASRAAGSQHLSENKQSKCRAGELEEEEQELEQDQAAWPLASLVTSGCRAYFNSKLSKGK